MPARDMALAALTSIIWGFGFIAGRLALDDFSPAQLTALRFIVAALPVLVVRPPRLSWAMLGLIGLTLFAGQFLLLFHALALGLPPGLASVTQQAQAFFTVLLAAAFLREIPDRRQSFALIGGLAGLVLIGSTTGVALSLAALGLALGGAFSWAIGNLLVRRIEAPVLPLMVWCSLVPPLPALALSGLVDEGPSLPMVLAQASWSGIAAVLYLGVLATPVAYAMWSGLLRRHPAARVAPFALLAPCTGVVAAVVVFGESFAPLRLAGMALILIGLAAIVLPAGARPTPPGRR
jgi:O-acetylserine/cysteine efflux transporter